jgi:CubicO group peptidase (beta-lactamase class C family)
MVQCESKPAEDCTGAPHYVIARPALPNEMLYSFVMLMQSCAPVTLSMFRVVLFCACLQMLLAADSRTEAVDQLFRSWDTMSSPGCAVGISQDGQVLYKRAYGLASIEYGIPLTTASLFYLASVSKQFTATAVALAARDGKLSLDDSVRKFVPELPAYATGITVRDLIHHSSGIRDHHALSNIAGLTYRRAFNITEAEVVSLLARQRALNFQPGQEFGYSNANYVLLAAILRRATGMSLREHAEARIFRPLGMTSTFVHDDRRTPIRNRAQGHSPLRQGGIELDGDTVDAVGDGGVFSNIEDMLRWDAALVSGTLVDSEFVQQLLSPGRLKSGKPINYAFGFSWGTYRGERTVGHGGAWNGYVTNHLRFPDQRWSVVALCNVSNVNLSGIVRQIADLYLRDKFRETPATATTVQRAAPKPAAAVPVSRADLQSYVGKWVSDEADAVWTIAAENDRLIVKRRSADTPSDAVGPDQFRVWFATLSFIRDAGGSVSRLLVDASGVRKLEFSRQPGVPAERVTAR